MSDPFQPAETKHKVSYHFLQALKAHQYPTVISTRSPLISEDEYLGTLQGMPVLVQFSISTIADKMALVLEPHAPRPSEILKTIRALSAAGVAVSVRWQPFVPGFSSPLDETICAIAESGARHISFEHLKLPTEDSWSPIQRRAAPVFDTVRDMYMRLGAFRDGREFVLPASEKVARVLDARRICHNNGVSFGAGDNDLQLLSDGKACCAGVDTAAGMHTFYKYTVPYILKKQIEYGDEAKFVTEGVWRPSSSIDRFLNSKSRMQSSANASSRKVEYFLRARWNGVTRYAGPDHHYGISDSHRLDELGNKIYITSNELRGMTLNTP